MTGNLNHKICSISLFYKENQDCPINIALMDLLNRNLSEVKSSTFSLSLESRLSECIELS